MLARTAATTARTTRAAHQSSDVVSQQLLRATVQQPAAARRELMSTISKSSAQARAARQALSSSKQQAQRVRIPSSRMVSTSNYGQQRGGFRGIKIGHLFAGVVLLGVGATAIGLYDFYSTLQGTYPSAVRAELRGALRAANAGSYERASELFTSALARAIALAESGELTPDKHEVPWKVSGIELARAAMWDERAGDASKAAQSYDSALQLLETMVPALQSGGDTPATEDPWTRERVRAASIRVRIGELIMASATSPAVARRLGKAETTVQLEKAERYLSRAVEDLLRLAMSERQRKAVSEELGRQSAGAKEQTPDGAKRDEVEKGLSLPLWLSDVGLASALERLAAVYSQLGRHDYAIPLLHQAVVLMYPPPPRALKRDVQQGQKQAKKELPPLEQRCQAATLMNNLSSAYVEADVSKSSIEQASRWSRQALNVADQCRKEVDGTSSFRSGQSWFGGGGGKRDEIKPEELNERPDRECQYVAAVALLNLGLLSEMSGDDESARMWLAKSRRQAVRIGMAEGAQRAALELRRLGSKTAVQA